MLHSGPRIEGLQMSHSHAVTTIIGVASGFWFLFALVALVFPIDFPSLSTPIAWLVGGIAGAGLAFFAISIVRDQIGSNPHAPWVAEHAVDSFWLWDAGLYQDPIQPPLRSSYYETDVLIIGGGFTGMSAAWHLAQVKPEMKVTLIDAARCGYGASGRNAGWCMTQNLNAPDNAPQCTQAIHDLMKEGVVIVKNLTEEHGIDCDFTPAAIVDLTTASNPEKKSKRLIEANKAFGFRPRRLDANAVKERYMTDHFTGGGVYDDGSASIHPGKLAKGMRDLIVESSVEVFEGTIVQSLDLKDDDPVVETEFGKIKAKHIIIATNAYTRTIGEFEDKYVPAHSGMIATEPLNDEQLRSIGLKHNELLGIHGKGGVSIFGILTVDNRIVYGGGTPVIYYDGAFPAGNNKAQTDLLHNYLTGAVWPQLEGLKIDHKWGGMVAVSRDMVGGVGQHPKHKNVHYAFAYSGEGVSTSFAAGKTLSHLVAGIDSELTQNPMLNRKMGWIPGDPIRSAAVKLLF